MTLSQLLRRILGRPTAGAASATRTPLPAWAVHPISPWAPLDTSGPRAHACPICRWTGDAFVGGFHSESAQCPQCGSISRDRFLFWCFVTRSPELLGARVLETSPRLGDAYRLAMASWFDYVCSDYDEGAHRGSVRLDLQSIDRPDECFDAIITPHVLEHVPSTADALSELHRVLAPGGRVYLQVPVLQGATAPPATPEFHGDNTPVFWRFGFDLTDVLRAHGFETRLLCTREWLDALAAGATSWSDPVSGEFDVVSMLAAARGADLLPVADAATAFRFGFLPAYMFLTWECLKA